MSHTYRLVRGSEEVNLAHVHCGYIDRWGHTGPCVMFNDRLVRIHQSLNGLHLRLIDMTMNGWEITGDYEHPNGFTAQEFIDMVKTFGADPRDFAWYEDLIIGEDATHWHNLTGVC